MELRWSGKNRAATGYPRCCNEHANPDGPPPKGGASECTSARTCACIRFSVDAPLGFLIILYRNRGWPVTTNADSPPILIGMRIVRHTAFITMPLLAFSGFIGNVAMAQAPVSAYTSVVGEITKVDAPTKVISIKTDKGATTVKFSDQTQILQLPAGELDPAKGTAIKAEAIEAGDKLELARVQTKDPTGLPARTVIVKKAADVTKEVQMKAQAWQTQTTAGSAESVDVAGKKIVRKVKGANFDPDRDVTLDMSVRVNYQRFSDVTLAYANSEAADAVKVGDHLRVLGAKDADGSNIKVTDIAADDIRQFGATYKSLDPATGQIQATDTAKKPVVIVVRPNTKVKRLDDPTALMIARIVNPSFQGGAGGRGAGRGAGGGAGAGDGGGGGGRGFGGQAGGAPGGSGFGGRGGGGGRGRGGANQIQTLLDQQPDIKIADLKPGEPIIVSGPGSADSPNLTATMVLAGVDPILRAAPSTGADPLGGGWSNIGGGGGGE